MKKNLKIQQAEQAKRMSPTELFEQSQEDNVLLASKLQDLQNEIRDKQKAYIAFQTAFRSAIEARILGFRRGDSHYIAAMSDALSIFDSCRP